MSVPAVSRRWWRHYDAAMSTDRSSSEAPVAVDLPVAEPISDPRWLRRLMWGVPLALTLVVVLSPLVLNYDQWWVLIRRELGIIELATLTFLFTAIVAAVTLIRRATHAPREARVWYVVLAVGCFYFAGEEASWGQHVLGFQPPESIREANMQEEFNIHNIDSPLRYVFNKIPRFLTIMFCLWVCGLIPLWWRHHCRKNPEAALKNRELSFWLPGPTIAFTGIFAACTSFPRTLVENLGYEDTDTTIWYAVGHPASEFKEAIIAWTLAAYALSLCVRHTKKPIRPSTTTEAAV